MGEKKIRPTHCADCGTAIVQLGQRARLRCRACAKSRRAIQARDRYRAKISEINKYCVVCGDEVPFREGHTRRGICSDKCREIHLNRRLSEVSEKLKKRRKELREERKRRLLNGFTRGECAVCFEVLPANKSKYCSLVCKKKARLARETAKRQEIPPDRKVPAMDGNFCPFCSNKYDRNRIFYEVNDGGYIIKWHCKNCGWEYEPDGVKPTREGKSPYLSHMSNNLTDLEWRIKYGYSR